MPLDTNTLPDRNPHFGQDVINWIDVQGRVAEYLIHNTISPTVDTPIKAVSLKDFPIQTADQLLSQLADAPTVERQSGHMLEVEHEVKVQLVRAQSKIAHSTRRAMGNTLIPAANADGFWLTYVGTNAGDRAAMLLHDGQYVAVDNFRDYFVWVTGDPIEIRNAFDALYRKDTSWSQLIDQPIGKIARAFHDTDGRRVYHGWNSHICRLYWHAKHTFRFPYDPNLDLAIMFHDAVYDSQPLKELRSAKLFEVVYAAMGPIPRVDPIKAYELIMDTEHHLNDFGDPRMILLDLADLMNPEQTRINYGLLQQESFYLYGMSPDAFASGSVRFMEGLRVRVEQNRTTTPSDAAYWWTSILGGIDLTIKLAQDKLNGDAPFW